MAVSNPGCIHAAKEKGARTVLWTRSQIAQTFTHAAIGPTSPRMLLFGARGQGCSSTCQNDARAVLQPTDVVFFTTCSGA